MAKKAQLRETRLGTVINKISKGQESEIDAALKEVATKISAKYRVKLDFWPRWYLKDIVANLRKDFPDVGFSYFFETSHIRPDGGVLVILDKKGKPFPILIGEVKNQGTNDLRLAEGKKKQAKGNAIERLGKNVIGLRTALVKETIFPFVCFGYGCDFAEDSSILDRVVTIAMFGELNKTHLHREGTSNEFNRGSFYFREKKWSEKEMEKVMFDIADRSILYYQSKYGASSFETRE